MPAELVPQPAVEPVGRVKRRRRLRLRGAITRGAGESRPELCASARSDNS